MKSAGLFALDLTGPPHCQPVVDIRRSTPLPDLVLTLRPLRGDEAVDLRLKRALKTLLRRDGFRCVEISNAPISPLLVPAKRNSRATHSIDEQGTFSLAVCAGHKAGLRGSSQ